jgi:hypothetical protein
MTIRRFFNQNIIIQRLTAGANDKSSFQSTATVEGHIQELSAQESIARDLVYGRTWQAWFDIDVNIVEGDRIRDEDGTEYTVKDITKKDYGTNQHLDVILEEFNE